MKSHYLSFTLAIILAFSSGYLAFKLHRASYATTSDIKQIHELTGHFYREQTAKHTIDFSLLYAGQGRNELYSPIRPTVFIDAAVPFAPRSELSKDQCQSTLRNNVTPNQFDKLQIWQSYNCDLQASLPKNFFATPPYIHPTGKSYALLALESSSKKDINSNWLAKNVHFFHISELATMPDQFSDQPTHLGFLSQLDETALQSLVSQEPLILSKGFLLARSAKSATKYLIYDASNFSNFINGHSLFVEKSTPTKYCFYRQNGICWQYNLLGLIAHVEKTSIAVFICIIFFLVLLSWFLIYQVRSQRLESQRKKFALEVLTHEFRTPVTNLILQNERIQTLAEKTALPKDIQECLPAISKEAYRLQRLTEETKQYLMLNPQSKVVHLRRETMQSSNSFVLSHLDMHDNEIDFQGLEVDRPLYTDSYWLGICLKNLIANAKQHGAAPIKVSVNNIPGKFNITISDAGAPPTFNLTQMTSEFRKSEASFGVGLGLNIVKKVIDEMNGDFKFATNPTRFTISLPQMSDSPQQEAP